MVRKKWTEEDINFIKKNYGVIPLKQMAEKLNTTVSSVQHKAIREGIKAPRAWTKEELEYIKNNYKTMTNNQLAEALGRSKTAVDLKINRLGLVKSKYFYNHSFFNVIDTEEKAYWLGFIMADGMVHIKEENNSGEMSINLQASDKNHLKKFNKSINGNVEVKIKENVCNLDGEKYKTATIRLYSQEICHDLEKYGVVQNKSKIKQFPEDIPETLFRHYIRGYYDGNGGIYITNRTSQNKKKKHFSCRFYTGSIDFANGLSDYLKHQGISTGAIYKPNKNSHCFCIPLYGIENNDKFVHFIYDEATIYLDRKFHKKEKIYKELDLEQRLLRLSEKKGLNNISDEENGEPETVIRLEGCV